MGLAHWLMRVLDTGVRVELARVAAPCAARGAGARAQVSPAPGFGVGFGAGFGVGCDAAPAPDTLPNIPRHAAFPWCGQR